METLTRPNTIERLRAIYFQPKKQHAESAYQLVKQLTPDELMREFNLNHNEMIKLQGRERNTRFSYEQFLLQHIRK